ncbi:MAG: proline dehydrogenase [Bryobacterales bacterium]|nr:proline dehydrogenase [Bryobacterales bacterium]
MRPFFLFLSRHAGLRRWMETHPAARRLTQRFVAGTTLEEVLAACAALHSEGIFAALDHLGENVTSLAEAAVSVNDYLAALDAIAARRLPATVSIKVTQFGLDLSAAACLDNVRRLAARARETGSQVEIDMESSRYTDRTLAIATQVAAEFGGIRCVIQAYLRRSQADIERLNQLGVEVRLCKGAYDEGPGVAFPDKAAVDHNYLVLMKQLLDRGTYPAIATHDETIIDDTIRYAREKGIGADRFEFQMLYGIRRDLQRKVVAEGYRLRVYVPYGTAWYPYFMRRLAERPANVFFLVRNLWR